MFHSCWGDAVGSARWSNDPGPIARRFWHVATVQYNGRLGGPFNVYEVFMVLMNMLGTTMMHAYDDSTGVRGCLCKLDRNRVWWHRLLSSEYYYEGSFSRKELRRFLKTAVTALSLSLKVLYENYLLFFAQISYVALCKGHGLPVRACMQVECHGVPVSAYSPVGELVTL